MKTKKLLLLLTFSLLCISVKAQTLTFDETVKYINDQISCCQYVTTTNYEWEKIEVDRNGDVTRWKKYDDGRPSEKGTRFNLSTLNVKSDAIGKWFGVGYIWAYQVDSKIDGKYFRVALEDYKGNGTYINFDTELLAIRVAKAFAHLQSLCPKKAKDPFDN